MKLRKNDWAFRVDVKTGKIEMSIPKVKSFTPAMIWNVVFAASRVISAMHSIMEEMMSRGAGPKKR
jgi:membrane-associated phospholipid phosphatase